MMNKNEARARIKKLRALIEYHKTLYYTFDAPEIDDAAFDALNNELEELERVFPDLAVADSPTQRVGASPLDAFIKVPHEVLMLSFNDAFSEQEMREWFDRLEKYLGKKMVSIPERPLFYCELKLDGLAIELVYEKGSLILGATRGDGKIGEDVTQNVMAIPTIPQHLEQLGTWKIPDRVVVRGEIFVPLKELERANRQQEARGAKGYANTRNFAAGSIRQLDSAIVASRKLESYQYDIVSDIGVPVATHEEKHKILASWGFSVNAHNRTQATMDDVFALKNAWEKKREKLGYEIDGIVVMINDNALFNVAGSVGKAPRGAIAYKFLPRQATTIVQEVNVQVGRTGVLTPVATLKPVAVSGVMISHATLHNFDEIKRLGLKIGDTVIVTRSGDVIPKIIGVIEKLRTGKERAVLEPKHCPVDGAPVVKDGVLLKCSNPLCGAKNRNGIIHFVSRAAFDIRGLGDKIVDRFLDEGLIATAADIFTLHKGDVAALERFGEKSARNLVEEIERKKKISIEKFIFALGIVHVGEETALALAELAGKNVHGHDGTIAIGELADYFKGLSLDALQNVPDIGPKVAQSIVQWFSDVRNQKLLSALARAGVRVVPLKRRTAGAFAGMFICLTGILASMSREQAKEKIIALGGHFQSDVTAQTTAIVVGENPGSKYAKAQKLGVPILNEEEFIGKLESKG
ncbi:MAG: NAD-dependent DNA ligase LigA [Candidatus Paceibacterota bacterium]|jgi:DNA ligase (NAD+)